MAQADFSGADLSRAGLGGAAGLETARLAGAKLRSVDLAGFWLPGAQASVIYMGRRWVRVRGSVPSFVDTLPPSFAR